MLLRELVVELVFKHPQERLLQPMHGSWVCFANILILLLFVNVGHLRLQFLLLAVDYDLLSLLVPTFIPEFVEKCVFDSFSDVVLSNDVEILL